MYMHIYIYNVQYIEQTLCGHEVLVKFTCNVLYIYISVLANVCRAVV